MSKSLTKVMEVKRSILTTYRKKIWSLFIDALKEYNLVCDNDKILVCISGGKDSFLMAILLSMLKEISKTKFELIYFVMDPGYDKNVLDEIKKNLDLLEINAIIKESHIFNIADTMGGKPCFLCARMRRGFLYNMAKELGCNKISLGHHFDDQIETTLLSMFYNGKLQTMPPKLKSKNYNIELIRPLYKIREQDIINYSLHNKLEFINCACNFSKKNVCYESKRRFVKRVIKMLDGEFKNISNNIFLSTHNVSINTMLGIKDDNKYIDFNELYKDR